MPFGIETWAPPILSALASVGSGFLGGRSEPKKETRIQSTQRNLIDQLLASLNGSGPFSDLYRSDEDLFQKSFVEPAQSKFRNQIAPQIQQQYIASGQQRGTGLDDQLLRAGVDLDSMLNQYMADFQQQAMNRKQGTINSILGYGPGAPNQPTASQDVMSSLSGYLSSPSFANTTANLFRNPNQMLQRKGFEIQ